MTPEIETQIEQREAMLARAKHTIKQAKDAIAATEDVAVKAAHQNVVNHREARVKELEAQIAQLRGKKVTDKPLTAS